MSPIKTFINRILSLIVNQVFFLDPEAQNRLKPFYNKILAVHIQEIDTTFYIVFGEDAIYIVDSTNEQIDATISAKLSTFAHFLFDRDHQLPKNMNIQGDVQLLQKLSRIMQDFQPDWEGLLAKYLGDQAAVMICSFMRKFLGWQQKVYDSFQQDMQEFLRDEIQVLPARWQVNDWLAEIDKIRDDVERLQVRIARLNNAVEQ